MTNLTGKFRDESYIELQHFVGKRCTRCNFESHGIKHFYYCVIETEYPFREASYRIEFCATGGLQLSMV